jgi:phosphoribosylaminoimidazolecarboxamide formyltransferase/IMP cyclohydrolase
MRIKRALISVWDKSGLEEFASDLSGLGVEIVSSGGTAGFLSEKGIPVIPVEKLTGFPEILDGRVKTLHPHIHGAILARRENKKDLETLMEHAITPIDMVVVNLYPFEMMLKKVSGDRELAEFIDIGGPTLLRAAAKNYPDVLVVCDPADYGKISGLLLEGKEPDTALRRKLAARVFEKTAAYDRLIASWLGGVISI